MAVKTLTVKAWEDIDCAKCGKQFDIEEQRRAHGSRRALFVVAPTKTRMSVIDDRGDRVPRCARIADNAASMANRCWARRRTRRSN